MILPDLNKSNTHDTGTNHFHQAKNLELTNRIHCSVFDENKYDSFCLNHIPPEVFLGSRVLNLEYDVWSIGIVVLQGDPN